jgi:hypothetical protein
MDAANGSCRTFCAARERALAVGAPAVLLLVPVCCRFYWSVDGVRTLWNPVKGAAGKDRAPRDEAQAKIHRDGASPAVIQLLPGDRPSNPPHETRS